jgi:hypothetical protein
MTFPKAAKPATAKTVNGPQGDRLSRLNSDAKKFESPAACNSPASPLRRKDQIVCLNCGRRHHRRSHRQTYCSTRCRQQANRRLAVQRLISAPRYPYSPPDTIAPKNISNSNGLQGAKSGSSLACKPVERDLWARIRDIEIFEREWSLRTSSDGVVCEVSRLRPRALQGRGVRR